MNESYKLKLQILLWSITKLYSLAELKEEDQKAFFSYVDGLKTKKEGLTAGQKKLPPALQKAILAKQGKKES